MQDTAGLKKGDGEICQAGAAKKPRPNLESGHKKKNLANPLGSR
jgi:hypothetical protein